MTARNISAKAGNNDEAPSATVSFDFGENLAEAEELFGADVVFSRFCAAATVDIQALIRRHLKVPEPKEGEEAAAPKTEAEIQAIVAEYKPGTSTRVRVSASEKAARAIGKLSDEEKAALLESLMGGGDDSDELEEE